MDALRPHRDLDPPANCAAVCMRLFVSFKQNVSRIKIEQSIKITLIRYSVQCNYAARLTTRKMFNIAQTFCG